MTLWRRRICCVSTRKVNCLSWKNRDGNTPLHINLEKLALGLAQDAVVKDTTQLLLDLGADPNIQNKNGDTPLHIACKNEAVQTAKLLLKNNKTNPAILNNNGKTANQLTQLQEIIFAFMERTLNEHHASMGELEIELVWSNRNDLDLHVHCPCKTEICFHHKICSRCSGELDVDMNAGAISSDQPAEHIFWKKNPPSGEYKVIVDHYSVKCSEDESKFFIRVKRNNQVIYSTSGVVCHQKNRTINIHNFRI